MTQAQRSAAGAFGAKEKFADPAGPETHLVPGKKSVAFRNQKHFVEVIDDPLMASCRIFRQLDRHLRTTRHLDQRTVLFLIVNEICHASVFKISAFFGGANCPEVVR